MTGRCGIVDRAVVASWSRLQAIRLVMALAMMAALWGAAPAAAQGTWGMVPNPISSSEFSTYMERLGATEPQRQAAAAFHEQYKADFKRLREGDIEKFMVKMQSFTPGRMPQRKQFEDFIDARKQVMDRVESIDNTLFNNLQPLLAEHQLVLLPRVKMARDRERYSMRQMMPMMGGDVDLSIMVAELDLGAEDRQRIDPILQGYEVRLTRGIKELHDLNQRLWLDMFDALEAAGITGDDDFNDPEKAPKLMEAMQTAMADVMKKSSEKSADIAKINRQTYRSLAPQLPRGEARRLTEKFFFKAYPEAMGGAPAPGLFARVLRLKDLTDEQRGMIDAAQQQYESSDQHLLEELADLVDEFRRTHTVFQMAGEARREHQAQVKELTTKRTDLAENAKRNLAAIVGGDFEAKLAAIPADEPASVDLNGVPDEARQRARDQAAQKQALAAGQSDADEHGPDQFLPGAITRGDAERYTRALDLDDSGQAILEELVAAHRQSFQELETTAFVPLREAQKSFYADLPQTDAEIESRLARMYGARAAALAAIQQLDEQFFSDLETMLSQDEATATAMTRARLSRQRDGFGRGHMGMFAVGDRNASASIDLTKLLAQLQLAPAELRDTDPVLIEYERDLTRLLKTRYEALLQAQRTQEQLSWDIQRAEEGQQMAVGMRYQEIMRDSGRRMGTINKSIVKLNRAALPGLVEALPGDFGRQLRDAYERQAFPQVYDDSHSAQSRIDAALALAELNADQRRDLESIALSFRGGYDELSQQMVALSEQMDGNLAAFEPEDWREFSKRQSTISKLRFDRDEISATALRSLRAALTPEQVAALGGLEDPPPRGDNPFE